MATGDLVLNPGSQTTVITGGATRATGVFSTSGEVTAITSNVTPFAKATLTCAYSVAPTEASRVHLYRRDLNIDSTNDATAPETGYELIYLGSFAVKDTTSTQYVHLPIVPLNIGDQEFYIENDANQTMSSGYTVKITPLSYNVAA